MSLLQKKSNHSINIPDSEPEDHPEAGPATNVTIHNAYIMGPAFGMKFPVRMIRYNIERLLNKVFKGNYYLQLFIYLYSTVICISYF